MSVTLTLCQRKDELRFHWRETVLRFFKCSNYQKQWSWTALSLILVCSVLYYPCQKEVFDISRLLWKIMPAVCDGTSVGQRSFYVLRTKLTLWIRRITAKVLFIVTYIHKDFFVVFNKAQFHISVPTKFGLLSILLGRCDSSALQVTGSFHADYTWQTFPLIYHFIFLPSFVLIVHTVTLFEDMGSSGFAVLMEPAVLQRRTFC